MITEQQELFAVAGRNKAMTRVKNKAGSGFTALATAFVTRYLGVHGEAPGEQITDECKKAGIVPHDDRAFGPVYMGLVTRGLIEKAGTCKRLKGHLTAGGNIWRLVRQ